MLPQRGAPRVLEYLPNKLNLTCSSVLVLVPGPDLSYFRRLITPIYLD